MESSRGGAAGGRLQGGGPGMGSYGIDITEELIGYGMEACGRLAHPSSTRGSVEIHAV